MTGDQFANFTPSKCSLVLNQLPIQKHLSKWNREGDKYTEESAHCAVEGQDPAIEKNKNITGCNSAELGAAMEGNDLPEYPKQLNGNSKWDDCATRCGLKKACVFWTFHPE